jgi:hypothetical protein
MVCVKAVQQADGTTLLALDTTNTNLSTCAYQVEDGSSNAWRELGSMTSSDAQVVAIAIGGFWAIAWVFKQIGSVIGSPSTPESD